MHGDGGCGVHVRVSCWLSAADGASEPCDIGAVGASASCVWCDERADGGTDGGTDRCTDGIADGCTYGCADRCTYGCADCGTDCSTDSSAHCRTDGRTDGLTDRITHTAPLRRRHALLLAQHA